MDKNFEQFLWISVSANEDVDMHFSKDALRLSAGGPCKNMRGDVTLGMERTSVSLAAMVGPETVCSRVTGKSYSDTLP